MGDLRVWPLGSATGAAPAAGSACAPDGPPTARCCIAGAAIIMGAGTIWRLMRTFSSPSVISISPMPDSWTRSISFFSLRRSNSAPSLLAVQHSAQGRFQRQLVSLRSQSADHAAGEVGEIGLLPEGFARVDVGQVDFYERDSGRRQGIAQCDAGVREAGRIDEDVCSFVAFRGMYTVYQGGLRVALEGRDLDTIPPTALDQALVDRCE